MRLSQLLRIDDKNDVLQIGDGQFVTGDLLRDFGALNRWISFEMMDLTLPELNATRDALMHTPVQDHEAAQGALKKLLMALRKAESK